MRNLDYHDSIENSREGEAVKKTLLTLIRKSKDLYHHLDDNDNLPSWVLMKISNAAKDTRDAGDYIISKLEKKCMDGNLTESELNLIIRNYAKQELINENLFGKVKSLFNKKEPQRSIGSQLNSNDFKVSLKNNKILNLLVPAKKLSKHYDASLRRFISPEVINRNISNNKTDFLKNFSNDILGGNIFGVNKVIDTLEEIQKDIRRFLKLKPTSARIKSPKKKGFRNLFGLLENALNTQDTLTSNILAIQELLTSFESEMEKNDFLELPERVKNAFIEELENNFSLIEIMKEIHSILKLLKGLKQNLNDIIEYNTEVRNEE